MNLFEELDREKAYSDQMSALAHYWMQQAKQTELLLAMATLAAGGEITVAYDLADLQPDDICLIKERRPEDMSIRLRAKRQREAISA